MVAYTKEEEDFIFDVWKSVRKHDKETGVLDSSSNRQRYIKVYQAYKNQGFTHTYSQIETKLKKHRATFIKTYCEGTLSPNPSSCPRYPDLLEMFGDVYQPGMMPSTGALHSDLDLSKQDKNMSLSFIDMNESKTSVADMIMNSQSQVSVHEIDNLTESPLSYLAFNGAPKSYDPSPINQNNLQKPKSEAKKPRRSGGIGGFKRGSNRNLLHPYDPIVVLPQSSSGPPPHSAFGTPHSAASSGPHHSTPLHHHQHHLQHHHPSSAPHVKPTPPSQAATALQRQHQATMKLLRGIRDDSKQHAQTLTQSVQTLATAILRLVEHDRSQDHKTTGDSAQKPCVESYSPKPEQEVGATKEVNEDGDGVKPELEADEKKEEQTSGVTGEVESAGSQQLSTASTQSGPRQDNNVISLSPAEMSPPSPANPTSGLSNSSAAGAVAVTSAAGGGGGGDDSIARSQMTTPTPQVNSSPSPQQQQQQQQVQPAGSIQNGLPLTHASQSTPPPLQPSTPLPHLQQAPPQVHGGMTTPPSVHMSTPPPSASQQQQQQLHLASHDPHQVQHMTHQHQQQHQHQHLQHHQQPQLSQHHLHHSQPQHHASQLSTPPPQPMHMQVTPASHMTSPANSNLHHGGLQYPGSSSSPVAMEVGEVETNRHSSTPLAGANRMPNNARNQPQPTSASAQYANQSGLHCGHSISNQL